MTADRPHLRSIPASGHPVERQVHTDAGWHPSMQHTPCRGCEFPTRAGHQITHYRGSWWHLKCAQRHLAERPESQAWIVLADQLARRPSAFKPREVKVITQALLDIIRPGYQMEESS